MTKKQIKFQHTVIANYSTSGCRSNLLLNHFLSEVTWRMEHAQYFFLANGSCTRRYFFRERTNKQLEWITVVFFRSDKIRLCWTVEKDRVALHPTMVAKRKDRRWGRWVAKAQQGCREPKTWAQGQLKYDGILVL